jgi:hypothetical protein
MAAKLQHNRRRLALLGVLAALLVAGLDVVFWHQVPGWTGIDCKELGPISDGPTYAIESGSGQFIEPSPSTQITSIEYEYEYHVSPGDYSVVEEPGGLSPYPPKPLVISHLLVMPGAHVAASCQ